MRIPGRAASGQARSEGIADSERRFLDIRRAVLYLSGVFGYAGRLHSLEHKMNKPIYVLNGPNLNRLGTREPEIYGRTTLAEVESMCRKAAGAQPIEFRQTNAEHQLVDWIHEAIDAGAAIIINPAGLSFRSVPVLDALKMFPGPIVELHISNIHRREEIYQHSLMSKVATAVIMGLGPEGYATAVSAMVRMLEKKSA
jgi:3-dehydroquinate dehydratase-2